jgi:hypothetical protein
MKGLDPEQIGKRAYARLEPYWDQIEANFQKEKEVYDALISQSYDPIGRVLKCHLIMENYIDRHLERIFAFVKVDDARLSFYQKAQLLPSKGSAVGYVKPGILEVNTIRNKFAHSLTPNLSLDEMPSIIQILSVARKGILFDNPVIALETFTAIACTWLTIAPPELEKAFREAFAEES